MKRKRFIAGFTIIELLTAIAVIAILIAILIPALAMVRRIAKETQQRTQFTTIDLAILAFRGDYGDYPPSVERSQDGAVFCSGAQNLAEALLGRDLLGFHSDSLFRGDGVNPALSPPYDDLYPADLNPETVEGIENLKKRKGPYLDVATANAFRLGGTNGLFVDTMMLDADAFVICDVFGIKNITLAKGQVVRAGTPILYYRANTSRHTMNPNPPQNQIYNRFHNQLLINLGRLPNPDPTNPANWHKLRENPAFFYDMDYGIIDPQASTSALSRPHRADSYILISAGVDGEYGTSDDIFNF